MAFYETFNLTIDDEIVDPSSYAQGDIQTTYAGTATTITQTHIVSGYKVLIEFIDTFADYVDLYLEGNKVISSRAVYGKEGFVTQFYGAEADATDYPLAQHIVSNYNTGDTSPDTAAIVGESAGLGTLGFGDTNAIGIKGVAMSLINTGGGYENNAVGLYGKALRDPSTANAALCIGVYGNATHLGAGAGATNTAFYANATSATTNYSFYGEAGDIYNNGAANITGVCAADTFRLASGKYIGYSAAVGTAPTGGLRFNTSNDATFTGQITCSTGFTVNRTNGIAVAALYRSDGVGGITVGEACGQFTFNGYATTGYRQIASVDAQATETLTDTQFGGRLGFYTVATGTATGAFRWYIDGISFYPHANNTYDIGTTSLKVKDYYGAGNVYAATATMGTATSYTQISAEGLKYFGDATTWDDLQFPIATGKVPAANFPDFQTFTTNTQAFAFDIGEYIDLQANEPSHGWKEGTTAKFHLHVAIKSAELATSACRFEINVASATQNGVFTETSLSANYTINTASALTHFFVPIGDLTLTGYTIGSQLLCRVKRVAETSAPLSEYADEIYILQVGCHLEYDSTGSRTDSTK